MKDKILGVYPTMITPYNKDGTVDLGGVKALTEWYYQKGCDGIFAICQSSEIFFLTKEERFNVAKTVIETASDLSKNGRKMEVVISGHVANAKEEQVAEFKELASLNPKALIFISNRTDISNTTDDAWIKETLSLADEINTDVPLGVYECPYPYKRLLSDKMLKALADDGRFAFMKDTCCDANVIANRNEIIKDSPLKLLNANAQTLLASLKSGGAGYSGVMANFHPELYVWLTHNFKKYPKKAETLQSYLAMSAFTECLTYPVSAKYHLKEIEKLPFKSILSRSQNKDNFTGYQKYCIDQMDILANEFIKTL